MAVKLRTYQHDKDFDRVGRFLVETYRTSGGHINWLQPRWEYMHFHPLIQNIALESIGVWEADGEIVAVVHPELSMGLAFFEVHSDFEHLKPEMLAHAEEKISARIDDGHQLAVWINEADRQFQEITASAGYERTGRSDPMSLLKTADLRPKSGMAEGFSLKSLADDNDLYKVHRLEWRGFGHGDEPDDDSEYGRVLMGVEGRKMMEAAPNFRKDLNIVVVAPNGDFVSYCGMWIEPVHQIAYVEPVATDPDYRRLGLGTAAVLEGVRRCKAEGAVAACVLSTMPFYQSMGFEKIYGSELWSREW